MTTEKLKLARSALEKIAAVRPHTVLYHDYLAMQQEARDALSAIAADTAPAAPAESVDTPEFRGLMLAASTAWPTKAKQIAALVAHINAWGAQQRDKALADQKAFFAKCYTIDQAEFNQKWTEQKERAEKAEAALEEWVHTNKADELQRAHDRLVAQLAARPAVDLPVPWITDLSAKDPTARNHYAEDQMQSYAREAVADAHDKLVAARAELAVVLQEREAARAQLAARAVGGVDVALARRKMFSAYSKCFANSEMTPNQIADTLLAAAPAAPVGDGDERALDAEAVKKIEFAIDQLEDAAQPYEGDLKDCISGCIDDIRAALTQQKGGAV